MKDDYTGGCTVLNCVKTGNKRMGKIVMFVGILVLLVGVAGVIFGFVGVPGQFTNMISQAVTPNEDGMCNAGERLEEEQGAESYTPGQGYSRPVRYFCVNEAGVRREVTANFVVGMFGDVFNSLGILLIPTLSGCVVTVGIFLTVIGWLFSRRNPMRRVSANNFVFPDENFGSQNVVVKRSSMNLSPESRQALTAKLREIEEARQAGMISEAEYQRMRQEAIKEIL